MKGVFVKLTMVILISVSLVTGVGVFATWNYVQDAPAGNAGDTVNVGTKPFIYLPGSDGNDTVDIGENHSALVDVIITHTSQGLNFSDFFSNAIDTKKGEDNIVYSRQNNVPGGTPKKFFNTEGINTQYLDFVMQRTKPNDDSEYYVFTFEDDKLYGTVGVSMIPCYRVTVKATSVLNGRMQYEAVAFAEGTAPLHRPKGYSFLAVNPLGFVQK